HVAQGQVAARRYRVPELPDDLPRVFFVPQAVQDAHEHDPDRLPEIEQVTDPCVAEDLLRLAQVGAQRDDVGAGHQRGRVGRHHRVDVRVDNARAGRGPLGDLVGVGHVRQAGPEVKELVDTLAGHV